MILQDVTAKVVGYCSKPNRDWFDENNTTIQELLRNKRKYYRSNLANLNDNAARTLYKASSHTLQSKSFRCGYGPTYQTTAPLRSSDGSTLLTSKADILNRWTGHYSMLFGDKRYASEESLENVPQKTITENLDDPPSSKKNETAISKLKNHKAPGSDRLPAEIFKMCGVAITERLTDLFALCWEKCVVP
ncbi:hypothetical protein BgiBS90_029353 [Biomphalaria glabrata]|nr:hypothetical protein BgiBS90_029353 [Biomphalaria glabrata]